MDVVEGFYSKDGGNPDQGLIQEQGNKYLNSAFPHLTEFKDAHISTDQELQGIQH